MIIQPPVLATSPAGTTNATTNNTGETAYVTVAANGATMANYWVGAVSVATSAAQFTMTVPPGGTCALQYTVAVPVWLWSPYTPAIPTSGTATTNLVTNNTGKSLAVAAWGGTTTYWYVNGTQVATTTPTSANPPLALPLPPGGTISVTYSAAPVWAWLDWPDLASVNSGGTVYAQPNTVAASGAGGYSPLTALPYAVHAEGGLAGLGVGVSN